MQRPISELVQRAGIIIHTAPDTSIADAVQIMAEHNIGAVVILENQTELKGIFTERDLLRRVVGQGVDPETTPVREVMTSDVIVVPEDMGRSDALQIMQEEHIRHLPVTDGETLRGIVSLRDLLRFEHKMQQRTIEQLREFVVEKPYPTYPG
jgi:CBS domain-containing protein